MTVLATTAPAEDGTEQHDPVVAVLYAITQLAVDTERNAMRIVALSDRIDELERQIEGAE